MHRPSSRATERGTTAQNPALTEFHALSGHDGPAKHCPACAAQLQRQRHAAAALRSHQRQARQQVDAVLDSDPGDTATDLRLEADAFGLHTGGFDDSPEGWAS